MTLPPQSARVMAFIEAEIAAGRGFPTHAAIREHMQWKRTVSATSVLVMLAGAGRLTKTWCRGGGHRGHWVFALRETEGA